MFSCVVFLWLVLLRILFDDEVVVVNMFFVDIGFLLIDGLMEYSFVEWLLVDGIVYYLVVYKRVGKFCSKIV